MKDLPYVYEDLVRKAFNCGRFGLPFADAGAFRSANTEEKLSVLRNYVLASLKAILEYNQSKVNPSAFQACQECFDALKDEEIDVEKAIIRLSKEII